MHTSPPNASEPSSGGTLVVLDPDAPGTTLRRVVPDAAVDEPLYLLVVYPDSEYERRRRAHAQAGVRSGRGVHDLADDARRVAERVGERCLGLEADFEAMGAVGPRRERVAEAVEERDVERVYLPETHGPRGTLRERVRALLGLSPVFDRKLPEGVTVTTTDGLAARGGDGGTRTGTSTPSDG